MFYCVSIHFLESKNVIAKEKQLPPIVLIAGKTGTGKSTALHNVFNIDTESGMDPDGVTKYIIKLICKSNVGDIEVYDTPGLGDRSIPYESLIREKMHSLTTHQDYIFLYTLRANPGARVDLFDEEIIKALTSVLGEQVWNKCVLLLTYSDTTWEEKYKNTNDKDEYKKFLKNMASKFQSCLKRYKPSVTIKTIFEVGAEINEELPTPSRQQDIVAIPTACSAKYDSNMLLPDITLPKNHDWSDLVFVALMRLVPAEKRKKYVQVKYATLIGSGIVAAATSAGALVGGIAGAIGGPLGAGAGISVGAAVGVAAGGAVCGAGLGIYAMTKMITKMKSKKDS